MATFSLKFGIEDTMSILINPGSLPTGSTNEAILHSQESHKIPIPKEDDYPENPAEILLKLVQFTNKHFGGFPIFFTEGGYVDNRAEQKKLINTERIIKQLFEKNVEYEIAKKLMVVPIPFLMYYIHNCNAKDQKMMEGKKLNPLESTTDAHKIFYASKHFEFLTEGCEYHNEIDKSTCCLSKVRCLGYSLAEYCSQPHKYQLIEGNHFPLGHVANSA